MQDLKVVEDNRMSKLIIGLILDGIGMISFSIPLLRVLSKQMLIPKRLKALAKLVNFKEQR